METEKISAAAARAEARRRKILENGNDRLRKITGRVHNEEVPLFAEPAVRTEEDIYPDPDFERDIYESSDELVGLRNGAAHQDIFELLMNRQEFGNQQNLFGQTAAPTAPQLPDSTISKFIRSKVPVIILSFLVYILFVLNMEFLVGGAVFISLIVWEIFEFIMTTFVIKQPSQQGGLVNILFMFGGINQRQTQIIMKALGMFNKVLKDIAIFMFTFVAIHLAWSFLVTGESLQQILDKDFSNLLKDEL